MSLVQCPECWGGVAATAPACPHCGYQPYPPPPPPEGFLDANCRACCGIIAAFVVAVFLLIVMASVGASIR
jgi:hypothetical protein